MEIHLQYSQGWLYSEIIRIKYDKKPRDVEKLTSFLLEVSAETIKQVNLS